MADATPLTDARAIHQLAATFQIMAARNTCPHNETPGKPSLYFVKKFSRKRRGKKATNKIHPGSPSHGRLSNIPESIDNNSL